MMKRIAIMASIITILASLGCGQQGRDDGKVELRWSGSAFPAYDKFRYEQSSAFEKLHPEVKIKYEPVSGAYTSKIMTQLAGGTAPDIFFVPASMYFDFVRRGVLMDMTPYLEKDKGFIKQYYPALLAGMNYKGKVYGLVSNNSFPVMYYNKDIFNKMKMPYPTNDMTLEETVELAKKNDYQRIQRQGQTVRTDRRHKLAADGNALRRAALEQGWQQMQCQQRAVPQGNKVH